MNATKNSFPEPLELEIPVPPSVNMLYSDVMFTDKMGKRRVRRVLTKKAKAYKEEIGWMAISAANHAEWEYHDRARISIRLELVFRDHRKRDITNCIKIVEDAISEALGFDDRIVDAFFVRRAGVDRNRPRARVSIQEIAPK